MSNNPQEIRPDPNFSTWQLIKEFRNASVEGFKQGLSGSKADWSYESKVVPKDVLEPCPTCKVMISTMAASCPRCGHPMSQELWKTAQVTRDRKTQRRTSYVMWGVALLVGFVVYNSIPYKTVDAVVRRETLACPDVYDTKKWSGRIDGNSYEAAMNFAEALGKLCRVLEVGERVKLAKKNGDYDMIISHPFMRTKETYLWIRTGHLAY